MYVSGNPTLSRVTSPTVLEIQNSLNGNAEIH